MVDSKIISLAVVTFALWRSVVAKQAKDMCGVKNE